MSLYFNSALYYPPGSASTCLGWQHQQDSVAVGYRLPEGNGGIVSYYNIQVSIFL